MVFFFNLSFELKAPKIFPRPHPISKILEFELSSIRFVKNLLNDSIYFLEESQFLLSQFLMTADTKFFQSPVIIWPWS